MIYPSNNHIIPDVSAYITVAIDCFSFELEKTRLIGSGLVMSLFCGNQAP
jgi:hypothetical protein